MFYRGKSTIDRFRKISKYSTEYPSFYVTISRHKYSRAPPPPFHTTRLTSHIQSASPTRTLPSSLDFRWSFLLKRNGKGVPAIKADRESRGIAPLVLNLGRIRWRVVCFTSRPLYPKERTLIPLNRRLGGPHSPSGRFVEQKNLLSLPGFEPRTIHTVA